MEDGDGGLAVWLAVASVQRSRGATTYSNPQGPGRDRFHVDDENHQREGAQGAIELQHSQAELQTSQSLDPSLGAGSQRQMLRRQALYDRVRAGDPCQRWHTGLRRSSYSGWRSKETKGPRGWGLLCLGSQLARVTAFGSKGTSGNRMSRLSALYMKGGAVPMAPVKVVSADRAAHWNAAAGTRRRKYLLPLSSSCCVGGQLCGCRRCPGNQATIRPELGGVSETLMYRYMLARNDRHRGPEQASFFIRTEYTKSRRRPPHWRLAPCVEGVAGGYK